MVSWEELPYWINKQDYTMEQLKKIEGVIAILPEEKPREELLICPLCGSILAERTFSGTSYIVHWVRNCIHYYWQKWGNLCYNLLPCEKCSLGFNVKECNKLFNTKVLVLHDGTTVYTLHPI